MLQLIAARRIAPEPEVEASLLGGLLHLRALRKLIQFDAPLSAIVSSPDGSYIVSADRSHHLVGGSIDTGNNLRFWDAKSGRPIGAPLGHKSPVDAIAFSPDGSLRLWDARNGQPIDASIGNAGGAVYSAAFNPDGTRIVSGGCGILAGSRDRNDHLRLWDPPDWQAHRGTARRASADFARRGIQFRRHHHCLRQQRQHAAVLGRLDWPAYWQPLQGVSGFRH